VPIKYTDHTEPTQITDEFRELYRKLDAVEQALQQVQKDLKAVAARLAKLERPSS